MSIGSSLRGAVWTIAKLVFGRVMAISPSSKKSVYAPTVCPSVFFNQATIAVRKS
jgi:hypothetical protein